MARMVIPNILVVDKAEAARWEQGRTRLVASLDYFVATDDETFVILKNKNGETDGPHPIGILRIWLASKFP